MEITLPPEWEQRIADKVAGGEFPSADEVVREGLRRLFAEEEHIAVLRANVRSVGADRPQAAANLRDKPKIAFERLASQPGIGHFRRDLTSHPETRFCRVDGYLIVYRNHPTKGVGIIRVLHGRRDVASLLADEPLNEE